MLPKSLYVTVGRRIRKARKECSLTQEALANMVGLTRTSITNIERGKQKFLLHTLYDIASSLNIDPHTLLPKAKETIDHSQLEERLPSDLSETERDWFRSIVSNPRKRNDHGKS